MLSTSSPDAVSPGAGVVIQVRERRDVPVADTWNLDDIFPSPEAWEAALPRSRSRHQGVRRPQGHASARARARCSRRCRRRTRWASWPIVSTTIAALNYDQDQRDNVANAPPPAGAAPAGAVAAGDVVVQPGAAGDPARTRSRVDGVLAGAGASIASPRGPVPPAGARARREGRAPAVAGQPVRQRAGRYLRSAVDRRREVPDHRAVDRRRGQGDLRPAIARMLATNRDAGGPRRRLRGAPPRLRRQPEHLCRALQRRPAARLVPCAGARLRRRCSTRRCTATTSRRRWSRT